MLLSSHPNFRNQRIDFLRGIAILAVLLLHFHLSYHLDQSALNKIFSTDFIIALARNGNYGVTMFFVISGFLITSTSLERYGKLSRVDVASFYILRFARIMPCLLLVLALFSFFNFMQIPIFANDPNTTSTFLAIFSVLTFWHNVLMSQIGYFNYCLNIFWSLSVEEVFYIVFPILCIIGKKSRLMIVLWVGFIIVAPIYRSHYTHDEITALYGYFSCFDAIAMGCLSAIIMRKMSWNKQFFKMIQCMAVFVLITVYFYSSIMQNVVVGVSMVALSTSILLIGTKDAVLAQKQTRFNTIVCWFGKNSYELYLFHIIVLALMKEIVTPEDLGDYSKLLWMMLFFMASSLLAGSISKFYSQPMNRKIRELLLAFRYKRADSLSNKSQPNNATEMISSR